MDYFLEKAWKKTRELLNKNSLILTLEKNKTTLDICFSEKCKELFLPEKVIIKFEDKTLYAINPEALFFTKLNQLTYQDRTENKTKRDREVISILRKKINVNKLKKLIEKTSEDFWITGYF